MANTQRTIEILLQLKQSGQEAVAQLKGLISDLINPVKQTQAAFQGFSNAGVKAVSAVNTRLGLFRKELQSGELAVKLFAGTASAAFKGVEYAIDGVWGAITLGASAVIKVITSVLGFLNPLSLKGLVTGAAFGGAGLVAADWIKAADSAETYRRQLAAVVGDQAIANRLFDDFQNLSAKSGIEAEQLSEVFTRLYGLRVKDAEQATQTVAGISSFLNIDLESLLSELSNPNPRALKQLGIDLNVLGKQVELVSGNVRVQVNNTEEDIRQGLLDLLQQKFPHALEDAQQSFSTQVKLLRIQLQNYAQDFGAILLPSAIKAIQKINDLLAENRDTIVAVIRSIPQIASEVYDEISTILNSGKIASTLTPLGDALEKLLLDLLGNLVNVAVGGLKLLAVPFVAWWRVVLGEMQTAWDIFAQNLVPSMLNAVKSNVTSLAGSKYGMLLSFITGGASTGASLLPDLPVKPIEDSAKDFIPKVDAALDRAVKDGKSAVGEIQTAVKSLFDYVANDSKGVGAQFLNIFGGSVKTIGNIITQTLAKMKAEGSQNRSPAVPQVSARPIDDQTKFVIDQLQRTPYQQSIEQANRDAETQIEQIKNQLRGVEDEERLVAEASIAIRQQQADKIRDIIEQRVLQEEAYNDATLQGVQKEQADAKLSYDKDVEAWREALARKEMDGQQFDSLQRTRQAQLQEQLYQIYLQQRQAGQQVQLNTFQASGDTANAQRLQIQMDYEKQAEQLRQQYQVQGLISEQQYQQGLIAADKEAADKRLEVDGTLVDGMTLGFKKMTETIQSQAQIGEHIVDDFVNGFGNAFSQIITGTKSVGAAFRDMFLGIVSDLAKSEVEAALKGIIKSITDSGVGSAIGSFFTTLLTAANSGGVIPGYAVGDVVAGGPWGPDRDSVLAALTPGEFVVRRTAVQQPGVLPLLRAINAGLPVMRPSAAAAAMQIQQQNQTGAATAAAGAPAAHILPALVANESQMATLLAGGPNAFFDFVRKNRAKLNGVLNS